jgi:hypothetical protein
VITLVLDDSTGGAGVIAWLVAQGELYEDTARGYVELACRRVRTPRGDELAYLEDHVAEVRFVTIEGPHATTYAEAIIGEFRFVARAALLGSLGDEATPGAWIRALSKLAVLRPAAPDPAFVKVWSRALSHPVTAVRRAAIRTCYGCGWPELRMKVAERIELDVRLRGPLVQLAAHLRRVTS